jgi:Fe-S-cluster containining protein
MGDEIKMWFQSGLRFECTQCGKCCGGVPGYVWVTREEIAKIAALLGLDAKTFARRYVRRVGFKFSLIEKADYDCIFLRRVDGKAGCAIYPVRPLQCRTWPFWNVNVKTPESWAQAAENCPGMNCGEVQEPATIERARTAKRWSDVP